MRIFLIGFMGSGKSHVGRRLAKALSMIHIDLDDYITEQENRSIPAIFATEGEARFRQIERACLLKMDTKQEVIISCGGGTPCFFDQIDWMNEKGLTIFLDVPEGMLIERLIRNPAKRPLLEGMDQHALQEYIHDKLAARRPFYEEAKVVYCVEEGEQEVSEGVLAIVKAILEREKE